MPFFLIMEYLRAGSNFLTFTYYLKTFNMCGSFVGGFLWLWFCGVLGFCLVFFFNGQVAVRSLQVFGTRYSVISQLLQVKQEAPS